MTDQGAIQLIAIEEIDDESLIREVDTESEYFLSLKEYMRRTGRCPGQPEVRHNGACYTLIEGAHRVMAAFQLGWSHLMCLVRTDIRDETHAKEEALASFNKIPPKPTAISQALEEIKDQRGYTIAELATNVGMTRSQVNARLKIKKLGGRCAELVDQGAIPLETAKYLAKLQKTGIDPNADAALLQRCATEPSADVIPTLKALIKGKKPARTFPGRKKREVVDYYLAIENNPDVPDEFKAGVLYALGGREAFSGQ